MKMNLLVNCSVGTRFGLFLNSLIVSLIFVECLPVATMKMCNDEESISLIENLVTKSSYDSLEKNLKD
jgi:hypothetical protein